MQKIINKKAIKDVLQNCGMTQAASKVIR
jgi:hypothetical protein